MNKIDVTQNSDKQVLTETWSVSRDELADLVVKGLIMEGKIDKALKYQSTFKNFIPPYTTLLVEFERELTKEQKKKLEKAEKNREKFLKWAKEMPLEKVIAEMRTLIPEAGSSISRLRNCFTRMEVTTLGEVVGYTRNDLLKFRTMGETSLAVFDTYLEMKGGSYATYRR